jgi:hypothetical protein
LVVRQECGRSGIGLRRVEGLMGPAARSSSGQMFAMRDSVLGSGTLARTAKAERARTAERARKSAGPTKSARRWWLAGGSWWGG